MIRDLGPDLSYRSFSFCELQEDALFTDATSWRKRLDNDLELVLNHSDGEVTRQRKRRENRVIRMPM